MNTTIRAQDITLTVTPRGYAVHLGTRLCGWVQATPDDGWQAVDMEGRLRVRSKWNRTDAAISLAALVSER